MPRRLFGRSGKETPPSELLTETRGFTVFVGRIAVLR